MRRHKIIMFVLSLLLVSTVQAQNVRPSALEYWFDKQFDTRQSLPFNGTLDQQIDVSQLCKGVHTLEMRICDTKGRWGAPIMKYFIIPDVREGISEILAMEYWFDYQYDARHSLPFNGVLNQELDVSQLCKGVHTLGLRVCDSKGIWGAPIMKYFIIPDIREGIDKVTAYEYWFNDGPRHRVETTGLFSLDISNVIIEITDVYAKSISDEYVFNVSDEMVTTPQDVFFGMQVFNGADQGSLAALSDTFIVQVPVDPHFLTLENSQEQVFNSPQAGQIQGLKTSATNGSQLLYTISSQSLKADFYDTEGHKLAVERNDLTDGTCQFKLQTATDVTYALVYDVSNAIEQLTVTLSVEAPSGIIQTLSGMRLKTSKNLLTIDTDVDTSIKITHISGNVIINQNVKRGNNIFQLPTGIYVVQTDEGETAKIYIP